MAIDKGDSAPNGEQDDALEDDRQVLFIANAFVT